MVAPGKTRLGNIGEKLFAGKKNETVCPGKKIVRRSQN
jgi:hypothetical protein